MEKSQKKQIPLVDRIFRIVCGVIAIGVVVALILYISLNSLADKGYFLRKHSTVTSQNYEINNSMMSYFFYEEYRNFVNKNYDSINDMGLSSAKSLKKQKSYYGDGTWYDHFMTAATDKVKQKVALAEAAKSAGMSLGDEENAEIDRTIERKQNAADGRSESLREYLAFMYGRGVTEKDVRDCLKLNMLADKYYQSVYDSTVMTDDEINAKYEQEPQKYMSATCKKYVFKYAENGKKAESAESFDEYINAVLEDITKDYKESYSVDLERSMAEVTYYQLGASSYDYGENKTVDKLAFSDTATVSDTAVTEKDGEYTGYCVVSLPARAEYATKNIRLIKFNFKTYGSEQYALRAANSVLESWNDSTKTQVYFKGLVAENSEDTDSYDNGGLYLNLKTGVLESAVEEWAFSDERKENDCTVITGEEAYYVVLFEGNGVPAWQADIIAENFDGVIKEQTDKFVNDYSVKVTKKYWKKIGV